MAHSRSLRGGLKVYWRRRASNYSRLRQAPPATILLGSIPETDASSLTTVSTSRPRRFWRIPRRVQFLRRIESPKRWLARLRDAYVSMMLRIANGGSLSYGHGYGSCEAVFGMRKWKEYDEKMLVEIYKQLLSQGGIVTADTGVAGRQIAIKGS